jgi:hypothetical protein
MVMRKFIIRILVFFGSALVIFLVALFLTSGAKTSIIESRNLLELGNETTTIILGDSQPNARWMTK